jgi:hypothetical protein
VPVNVCSSEWFQIITKLPLKTTSNLPYVMSPSVDEDISAKDTPGVPVRPARSQLKSLMRVNAASFDVPCREVLAMIQIACGLGDDGDKTYLLPAPKVS